MGREWCTRGACVYVETRVVLLRSFDRCRCATEVRERERDCRYGDSGNKGGCSRGDGFRLNAFDKSMRQISASCGSHTCVCVCCALHAMSLMAFALTLKRHKSGDKNKGKTPPKQTQSFSAITPFVKQKRAFARSGPFRIQSQSHA